MARITPEAAPADGVALVDELDRATIDRIRRTALTMRARYAAPIVIDVRYVSSREGDALVGALDDLRARNIHVVRGGEATRANGGAAATAMTSAVEAAVDPPTATTTPTEAPAAIDAPAPEPLRAPPPEAAPAPMRHEPRIAASPHISDPFGVDVEYRRAWLRVLRVVFERYWRVEVSGIENVPEAGGALIAANHSGAIPADAFMLAVALELHHPARRCLRVLYDKFVGALPWIGPLYNRLGGVPSSFANAELMLKRGELLAIFPEGISGVEKRWIDRYQLQPFRSGTARLSIATGRPIVPVAIVGAEEAYPVVARLYRAGRVVGVPWIPVTPLFPLCGIAGALPLPTKWHMRFCPPIEPPAVAGDPERAIAELTTSVRRSIAVALGDLLLTRRGIFI